MSEYERWWFRLGVLVSLIKNAPQRPGRTGIMKFAYLLQAVRGVPLGYRFELYNYGPYDSSVLNDLSQARSLGAIKSEMVRYPNNYGYEFEAGEEYDDLMERVQEDLAPFQRDVDWVLELFGHETAGKLELISTIVYAYQEAKRKRRPIDDEQLTRRVHQIKPHFTEEIIMETIHELREKDESILASPDTLPA